MFVRKLLSHSLIYALGPQIPKVAGIFVLPLLTQYLTTNDYGVYGIVSSYTGILTGAADLGFAIVLVNSFYKYPVRWPIMWKQLHFYLLLWSVAYSILMAILLIFVVPKSEYHNLYKILALVCIPAMIFNPTVIIASRYYQFAQKPFYLSVTSGLVGAIAIFLNLYFIVYRKSGYMGWFLSTAIASAVQFVLYIYPVFFKYKLGPTIAFRKKFLFRHLKVSLPTVPHNYSTYLLNSSDRIVMDNVGVKVSEIGKFNMAYTFGNYFEFFVNAVGMALGPFYTKILSKRTEKSEKDYLFITRWLQLLFLLIGFTISLWAREVMKLLIKNDQLNTVYNLSIIIIMGYVSRPYYWSIINRMEFEEKTNKLWRISLIAGIINVVLNIILVPRFGIMSAAITTYVALLYFDFSGFYIGVTPADLRRKYSPFLVTSLVLGCTVFVYACRDVGIWYKIGLTFCLATAFLIYSWKSRYVFKTLEI